MHPRCQFPTGYEPRWLSRSAEVLRKPAGLLWHPGQVTNWFWKVLSLRQHTLAVNPVIGMCLPPESPQVEAGSSNKSCDWHAHFRKSSGLRHPPSFPNYPFFFNLVARVKIFFSTAPPLFGHQPYQTPPWVPQFQSLVTPYGMPFHCMHLLGPWFFGRIYHSIHCPSPWFHTSDHLFISFLIQHSFIHSISTAWTPVWFKTHIDICNSIVGPQDLWRCCPSEVGYEPDRSVILSFVLLFLPLSLYFISMLLHLRGCVGNTSSSMYLQLFVPSFLI